MSDLACSTRARFPSTEARRLIVALPYFNDTQSVGGVVMAQRTMTVCDIDDRRGDTVVATAAVRLDLAGEVHQLDVCAAHLDELRAALTAVLRLAKASRRADPCVRPSWLPPSISGKDTRANSVGLCR